MGGDFAAEEVGVVRAIAEFEEDEVEVLGRLGLSDCVGDG